MWSVRIQERRREQNHHGYKKKWLGTQKENIGSEENTGTRVEMRKSKKMKPKQREMGKEDSICVRLNSLLRRKTKVVNKTNIWMVILKNLFLKQGKACWKDFMVGKISKNWQHQGIQIISLKKIVAGSFRQPSVTKDLSKSKYTVFLVDSNSWLC